MEITRILTNSITPKTSGVCGEFSVVFDNSLCIHKILVVNGKKGLFITFPNDGQSRDVNNTRRYVDIVHPTNNTLRQYIQQEVLSQYNKELEKRQ
jgi:DNA-binding cell septation regulator SpoVG